MRSLTPPPSPSHGRRPVDEVALQRWRARVEQSNSPIWLHEEVSRRMGERLALIKQAPLTALIWGPPQGTGHDLKLVTQTWPQTRCTRVHARVRGSNLESEPLRPDEGWVAKGKRLLKWRDRSAPALSTDQVPHESAGLVWSNMGLHVQADPVSVLRTWAQCLTIDGFVMFSTLGPGSLPELRSLYQMEGWGPPLAPLVDMHDLGDMMVQAGLADPVVDQETLTLTWATAADALAELRTLGQNAATDRFPGLRTTRWRQRLEAALEASRHGRADGRVALSFEVVYGHAFKPLPKIRVAAQTAVPLEDMRTWIRGGRRSSGSAP